MPFRNEAVFYVERPIEFEFEDGHVKLLVASGRWSASFLMSETNFFATCAKAGIVATEVRRRNKRGTLHAVPTCSEKRG